MELLFESRVNLSASVGTLRFVQVEPEIHPEPVLRPDSVADRCGASIYGSVIRDGGRLRMWYQAWPQGWDYRHDVANVAYAESLDGIHWEKPDLGVVRLHDSGTNLCNFALHSPSVYLDPHAPASHRYRGTGYTNPGDHFKSHFPPKPSAGYYSLHSADGLHWEDDQAAPQWEGGDVISSTYHPARRCGVVAMKQGARIQRIDRRLVHTAELHQHGGSPAVSALYPDEYDDVVAMHHGHASTDYYGMGLLPAGHGMLGFLWTFRHDFPYIGKHGTGFYGPVDVSLVYQQEAGGRWLHAPGRRSVIPRANSFPWMRGALYTASAPVEFDGFHWLYFSAAPLEHGFYLDENFRRMDRWAAYADQHGKYSIGVARWPRFRFVGLEAMRSGAVTLDLGPLEAPATLRLNYTTQAGGSVRVEQLEATERSLEEACPLTGESASREVTWKGGANLQPAPRAKVRLHLERASVYAYEVIHP